MSKNRETAAERIWKEKLELCGTPGETAVLVVFAGALASIMLMVSLW